MVIIATLQNVLLVDESLPSDLTNIRVGQRYMPFWRWLLDLQRLGAKYAGARVCGLRHRP
jgi:hypothetical protein